MAADVLNGHPAVKMNVFVLRAFVKQRETLATNQAVLKFLAEMEKTSLHACEGQSKNTNLAGMRRLNDIGTACWRRAMFP